MRDLLATLAALWRHLTYRTTAPHPHAAAGLTALRDRHTGYDWTRGRPA